ncbi:hypothetical protein EVAR_23554_1 [Eumeta japonica]|uniref:Uncharacterized protein n=1 Tax=Eumeta variegata TaxID=151549 RepID=A0A4C1X085_EUMVA|nr:hypothetical protein EVAR_23554_1 [Eumeta japonica]
MSRRKVLHFIEPHIGVNGWSTAYEKVISLHNSVRHNFPAPYRKVLKWQSYRKGFQMAMLKNKRSGDPTQGDFRAGFALSRFISFVFGSEDNTTGIIFRESFDRKGCAIMLRRYRLENAHSSKITVIFSIDDDRHRFAFDPHRLVATTLIRAPLESMRVEVTPVL